jgi:hypothetical protein
MSGSGVYVAGSTNEKEKIVGFMDKAKDLANEHDDKVDDTLEKAGDQVDERTGSKHSQQIDKGVEAVQRRTGQGDTTS